MATLETGAEEETAGDALLPGAGAEGAGPLPSATVMVSDKNRRSTGGLPLPSRVKAGVRALRTSSAARHAGATGLASPHSATSRSLMATHFMYGLITNARICAE